MNSFGFNFDKALDSVIDGIEHSVVDRARAAASDLLTEEYKTPPAGAAVASAPADLSKLKDVAGFWRLFDIQVLDASESVAYSRPTPYCSSCFVEVSVKKAGTTCSHDLCPFQRRKAEIQAQVEIIKRGEGRCVRALLYTESTVHQL